MRRGTRGLVLAAAAAAGLWPGRALAFGPEGHKMIGAVADQKLKGTPTAAKVQTLLDGLTLARAATIPDEIKSYDAHPDLYVLPGHPQLTADLRAFLKANPNSNPKLDHHQFHYTDIPVEGTSVYGSGTVGRSDRDGVQTVTYCMDVLTGARPEANDRKITKAVAVILLAHVVGDLHQPLHVGAEYFGADLKPVNPDTAPAGATVYADKGGGGLNLRLRDAAGNLHVAGNLHSYWDGPVVTAAVARVRAEIAAAGGGAAGVTDADVAKYLAAQTPAGWAGPAGPAKDWSRAWADQMMPVARAAHQRLEFSAVTPIAHNHTVTALATERAVPPGADSYAMFGGKVARDGIHRAGWRLAAVLENVLP